MRIPLFLIAATATWLPTAAQAQKSATVSAVPYSYSDLADLALAAPLVLIGTVVRATDLPPEMAPGVPIGRVRMYVEADAARLIRGPSGVAPRITYLADVATDSRGRPPKLRRSEMLVFAKPVPGKPGQLQLVAPDAQLPVTPALEAQVRAILTEAVAADAPPRVTGVASAFHVPGVLPGESETQIFLTTADRRPISLTILRRPNLEPRWAVALGEIVDEAASPPEPETLLWYRLACGLPRALPPAAIADLAPAAAQAAADDYRLVLDRLGPCGRTRGARAAQPELNSTPTARQSG
jgi:hypothetical protein